MNPDEPISDEEFMRLFEQVFDAFEQAEAENPPPWKEHDAEADQLNRSFRRSIDDAIEDLLDLGYLPDQLVVIFDNQLSPEYDARAVIRPMTVEEYESV